MKKINMMAFLLLSVLIPVIGLSQTTIGFTYDNSGNRETRTVITLKSATTGDGELAEEPLKPIEGQVGLQKVRIYPNPTKGLLKIDFPVLSEQETIIRVHDPHGKPIIQQLASGSNLVNLSSYPPGSYILVIRIGQEKKAWKIIKE